MKTYKTDNLVRILNALKEQEPEHPLQGSDTGIIHLKTAEGIKEKQVREFYERYPYHKTPPTAHLAERILQYRRDWANWCIPVSLEGKRTLDVGCGCGFNLAIQGSLASVAIGIDVSISALCRAYDYLKEQGVWERVFLIRGDIRHLPIPDGSLDIITCVGVLHHIWDHKAALEKMSALLDVNGILLLGVYHPGGRFLHRLKQSMIRVYSGEHPERQAKLARWCFNIEKEARQYRIPPEIYVMDSYTVPVEKAFSVKYLAAVLGKVGLQLLEVRPSPGSSFASIIQKFARRNRENNDHFFPVKHRLVDWWLTCTGRHHYWCLAIKK